MWNLINENLNSLEQELQKKNLQNISYQDYSNVPALTETLRKESSSLYNSKKSIVNCAENALVKLSN